MIKYIVGGAVRDKLLNIPVIDRDWVVVGSTPKEMLNKGYKQVGKDFPVFIHPISKEEYALARTEKKSSKGYTGFTCYFSPKVKLEEDLFRRDLTINAIAQDEKGNLIDPYQGQKDIQNRKLRHVSDAFKEDPLRVLRVARFAARFSYLKFRIVNSTFSLMKKMKKELVYLSPERIWKETERALETNNPSVYFDILRKCGGLEILFPEIDVLFNIKDNKECNKKNNLGIKTLKALSNVSILSKDVNVRFATLCFNLGNNLYTKKNFRFAVSKTKILDNMCKRLRIPNSFKRLAKVVVKHNNLMNKEINYLSPKDLIKFFNDINAWKFPKRLEHIIHIMKSNSYIEIKKIHYLKQAFHIACSINTKDILKKGFTGIKISRELNLERKQILLNWMKS